MRMTDLRPGWAVVGNEERRIGTVKDVRQDYIVTSRPGLAADLYVPVSAVANVARETIHLNIRQTDVELMGWEQRRLVDDELDARPPDDLHRHI
jgi:hypothetical protein